MKIKLIILYFFEIVFLVLPISIIRLYLGFLYSITNVLNSDWDYIVHFLIIAIYMFLVITIAAKTEKRILKRKEIYNFDNVIYLTISTIILLFIIYIKSAINNVFRYDFFPYSIILFFILIIGPILTFFLPHKKIKGWLGLFFILCYYVFISLALVGVIFTLFDSIFSTI
jgi:hypothetical protein